MKKKIAIVRGCNLNKWEMQNYETLSDSYDITAYTTRPSKFDISQIEFPVVQLSFQSSGLTLYLEGLEEHLADKELIYTADTSWLFSAQAIVAKERYGCKVICMVWENIPFNHEDNKVISRIKEIVRNSADHFITVTERAKEVLMLEGVPERIIDVIPMGVDLSKFRPNSRHLMKDREELMISSEDIVILFIGRMEWEKGVYNLVHAAGRILGDSSLKNLPIKFLLTGNGVELNMLRERAMRLEISDRIIFLDSYPYDKMHRLYNLADIFILPSIPNIAWQEQFGMVLVESMACGKPVISTLSGSIPEVVGDAGILIQPNDHLSLYRAIKKLILDKDLRDSLGKEALKRAVNNFDSKHTAERAGEVFEKVLLRKTLNEDIKTVYEQGLIFWKNSEQEKGFQMVCRAFNEDPDNKEVLDSIVRMGSKINKLTEVEKSLREYLNYHPANIETLITMAETLFCLGKKEEAEEELQKVFLFDPENKKAVALKEEIKKESGVMVD